MRDFSARRFPSPQQTAPSRNRDIKHTAHQPLHICIDTHNIIYRKCLIRFVLPALLISRSERSIVRVSIYNSSQPQVICPPAEYLDFPEFNYSSNLLDYNTMATTAAGIQQQQVIGLGAAYDRQQRWVAIIMGTILRKYIIVSWVISSIAAPIPAGTIPFDQAAICPERLMKLSI